MDTIANTTTTTSIAHQIPFDADRVLVRPVLEAEINSVAEIIVRSFQFDRGWRGWFTPIFRVGIAEDLRHRLRSTLPNLSRTQPQPQICSIALYTHQGAAHVVGTVEVGLRNSPDRTKNWYAYISNLAVSNDFRRRGVATALLQECERIAKIWGYTELHLHVMADNQSGRNLYQKSGYELVSTDFVWSIVPWNRPQRLFLRKQLS